MPRKLPKRLSFNGKARSSGKAMKMRDWQGMTHERNFTGTFRGTEQYVNRELDKVVFSKSKGQVESIENKTQALMDSIKKIRRRLDRKKVIAQQHLSDEGKTAAIQVMKLEELLTRQLHLLTLANAAKQHKDKRELNRLRNRQAIENGEMVRLEGKLVPSKSFARKLEALEEKEKRKAEGPLWTEEEKKQIEDEFNKMME